MYYMTISRENIFKYYKNKDKYKVYLKSPKTLYFKGVLIKDFVKEGNLYYSDKLNKLAKSLNRAELGLLGKLKHLLELVVQS